MNPPAKIEDLAAQAINLLRELIATPSVSGQEDKTAEILERFFIERNIEGHRSANNVWVKNEHFDDSLPVLLLNSHHDTVPPNSSYTRSPFEPETADGKIFGLGSNDAGGPLVSLIGAFLNFYHKKLPINLIFAASAEEEISGKSGIESLLKDLPKVDMAIVGEPTLLSMAIAEKGLLVLDCISEGKAGHAARDEGENALYKALDDINILRNLSFEKISPLLGPVHIAVTSAETKNKKHNVVPDECTFIVDVRVNELYSLEEVVSALREKVASRISPRSLRLKPSFIDTMHPLVQAGIRAGLKTYGSPTLSDMALMNFPAVKLGPGDSARSHMADEFIFVDEIHDGIEKYIMLIENLTGLIK